MSLLSQASLCVTPSAYKEGKLYSVIPSDGSGDMSVVRATTATRVNSAGLVELVPYNLLGYSQTFGNAYWTPEAGNTISSDSTTAPDGTLTADTFTATSGNEINVHNATPLSLLGTLTYSIYLKNNGTNLIEAYLFNTSNNSFAARGEINFSAGTFTASVGTGTIENVGNGWFRVSLTNTYTAGTFTTGTYTTSTTGTRSVYAWGAQLVEGTLPKDYLRTETRLNIPRLDYSNGTCPSLLVEPQRTNLLTYSSSFDNAGWTTNNATITANAIISPSGIQDAELLTSTSTTETGVFRLISVTGTNTWSVYAKKGSGKYLLINTNAPLISAKFDLESGQVVGTPSGGATATIQDSGNGWYRCVVTSTTAQNRFTIFITNNTIADDFTSSVGLSCYIWGAQLEAGSYSTSFIPTTSASVTRNADVISKTGISSLIGQTEGVMFADFVCDGFEDYGTPLSINDGTASNYIWLTTFANGNIRAEVYNGSVQASITYTGGVVGQRYKVAFAYKQNDFVMYVNGTQIGADASGNVPPSLSRIDYNLVNNWSLALLNVNATALWKTRLTNDQLEQLTGIGFNTYAEMANYYNYTLQ
jgi:hypothetical protein